MEKVLFILHLPPPVHGSSMVGQSIKNSRLINTSFDCSYINLLVSRKINETGKFSFLKIIRFVGVWYELLLNILKKKPEACYLAVSTTGLSFYKDVLLVLWLRLFKIKRIYHLHNKGVSYNDKNKINKLLYKFVFKDACVILLSKKLYPDIEHFVPVSQVYICPNGIDNLIVEPRIYLKDKSPVNILFLSNLIESKGVSTLLDACAILQEKELEFECSFVGAEGDINITQFNDKVLEHKIANCVTYLGRKFGKEKHAEFIRADIFAFPTYYSNECFPLVILEAMCAGLPVVSTFEGGIPDIVDDGVTGFLVTQKDIEALAAKLETLIRDSELRRQQGEAGKQKFGKEFTVEKFEHRLLEILQLIIAQP